MLKSFRILVLLAVVGVLGTSIALADSGVVGQVPGRVVITLAPGVDAALDKSGPVPTLGVAAIDDLAARYEVRHIEPLYADVAPMFSDPKVREDLLRVYAVDFAPAKSLGAALDDYGKAAGVEKAEAVDICRMAGYVPDDLSDQQYYLRNVDLGGRDVRALGGWQQALGDSNVIVAILDSGLDYRHPDLGGPHPDHVNGAVWTNWTEYYGSPGVDDDANGKVDDIRGWDFVHVPGQAIEGEDDRDPDNDPMDFGSHGTNCAGCVAPITDNGIGIAATAPGCKVMAVRIGWTLPDGQGVVRMDFASQGMLYAVANGARIINCSWGNTSFLATAVQTVLAEGGLICVAAGNDNTDTPESNYLGLLNDQRVLAVAATNSNDGKADFSNYGSWVELSAPGTAIWTTAYNPNGDLHTYTSTQGTSFASPIAAGAAALIWSAFPGWTASQVSQLLRDSCDNIDADNPNYAGELGAGRVNLLKALGDNVQEVPGEFDLLRDAMNQAATGDTIKVLASQPLGAATMLGKGLKIFGGYDAGYLTRDPVNNPTVLNGTPADPVLQFYGDVDNTCEVDGFRLTGGGGRLFSNNPYTGKYGGGVMLNQKSPTLRNLHLTGNNVGSNTQLGLGGGIALYNSDAVLDNVVIEGNSGIYGAGIFVYQGAPTFTGVTVQDNAVITTNATYPAVGGGIHLVDTAATLQDVTVTGHTGAVKGGGIYATTLNTPLNVLTIQGGTIAGNTARDNGAGICHLEGELSLTDVVLDGNVRTADATFMGGGGLHATAATVTLDGCTIMNNDAQVGGGLQLASCPAVEITSTLIHDNSSMFWGGGAALETGTVAALTNVTLAYNEATSAGGGGLYANGGSFELSNSISAFNTGGATYANGVATIGAAATLTCNDVFGNASADYSGVADPTGTAGNISEDPQFCDVPAGEFGLELTSPCAPENSGTCGLIGALPAGCDDNPVEQDEETPTVFRVAPNYPNPFNPSTTIRFELPGAARTRVLIYDVAGRHVKTLVDAEMPAAVHTVRWDGTDRAGRSVAAGVYFYRVTSGRHEYTGRMALIK